ncbi:unnamed protein product [Clonostachys byssicola]|uniref:F-box domain-containing protein n=1 Tax=Clonostachys byssicola TaxID=160290 RepID=A0A9N9Y5U1_9HYPO|nr:unnamed protein product [Clonostachys byssicola]
MTSYYCQICSMDMSIARIRTQHEPPSAAWNFRGLDYVGFSAFRTYEGEIFLDQQCQECTTADRTPADLEIALNGGSRWPDEMDEDDAEWLPSDHQDISDEPLEFESDAEESDGGSPSTTSDSRCSEEGDDGDANDRYPVQEIFVPPFPKRLPYGTWRSPRMYTRAEWGDYMPNHFQRLDYSTFRAPPEHIAAPSCRSVQGVNGNVLSHAEMKGCRNHRFLLAKPLAAKLEASDQIFEKDSIFILTGEANGSKAGMARPVYPRRHGLHILELNTDSANSGCNYSDIWRPLPVHSYCLDVFAKASHRRLGRVDLDAIWQWREMQSDPESYGLSADDVSPHSEVARGRRHWGDPWSHHAGSEWLAANPVEVPGLNDLLESCLGISVPSDTSLPPQARLLALPTEIIHQIFSFLPASDLTAVAWTCHTLRSQTQPLFKVYVITDMDWLWELIEGAQYPASPNWPATWDPCFPPGLSIPELPLGLEPEEAEKELWAQIIADDPEMEAVGRTVNALNDLCREAIYGPYRASKEALLRGWEEFRDNVESWIRHLPASNTRRAEEIDWARAWQLFHPTATSLAGVRNRARIWRDCNRILDYNDRLREQDEMGVKHQMMRTIISSRESEEWWEQHNEQLCYEGLCPQTDSYSGETFHTGDPECRREFEPGEKPLGRSSY